MCMMQNKPVWIEKPATEILNRNSTTHSIPNIQNQLHDPKYAVCSNELLVAPLPQMAKQMPTEV